MTITCKWIQRNNKPCSLTAIPLKHYCKLHKQFESLYDPSILHLLQRCSRCKAFIHGSNEKDYMEDNNNNKRGSIKCKACKLQLEKSRQKKKELSNKEGKKCSWINQKGKPCPWKVKGNVLYCKRHSIYEGIYQPSDIPFLKKCSGCKNLFRPLKKEGKTILKRCETCTKRSRIVNASIKENNKKKKKCIAMIQTKGNMKCTFNALENDDYCEKHQRYKKHQQFIQQGKRVCKNWTRGCFHILTTDDIASCAMCKLMKNNTKYKTSLSIYEYKYNTYKSEAKRRNIEWCIDKEKAIELFKGKCYYCGFYNGLNGIDRIDSNENYGDKNIVSCCELCNRMKLAHGYVDFIYMVKYLCYYMKLFECSILNTIQFDSNNHSMVFKQKKTKESYFIFTQNCVKRHIKNELNEENYNSIISHPCYYCGIDNSNGIDRVYSEMTYNIKNVVSCCKTCNLMKGKMKLYQFKEKLKNIYTYHVLKEEHCYQNEPRNKMIYLLTSSNIHITSFPLIKMTKSADYYTSIMFRGDYKDMMNIKIELEFVDTKTNPDKYAIWQFYRKYISSFKPKKHHNLFGKRIFILVKDKTTETYLGILSLSSDIKYIQARDNYIGWGKKQQFIENKLDYLVNISTCVSTQPFGFNFNGGKLLTSIAFSKEVLEYYYNKYNIRIQGITTMSLYGKSVQYDRLSCLKFLGYTKGNSLMDVPQDVIEYAKEYLKEKNMFKHSIQKNNLWMLKTCLHDMNIPIEDVLKSNKKGVYFGYTTPSSKDYLLSKTEDIPDSISYAKSVYEIGEWWKERWAKQRYQHLYKNNKLKS